MVVSDRERREVAARMRNQLTYMREDGEYYKNDLDLVECGNRAYRNIADSVEKYSNNFTGYYIPIIERLADLIDRPTCRNNEGYDRAFWCSACGYEAWTYDDSSCDPKDFSFCPSCGAEVVK
jgi:hypothetical protein